MSYTEMENTQTKLLLISEYAKRDADLEFTSLAHLLNKDYLKDCYASLNRNKAVGIDSVSRDYHMQSELHLKSRMWEIYKSGSVRGIEVPCNYTNQIN